MSVLEINPPPQNPGVYQFKNADGEIIYIGKAKNLRNRVRSYFNGSHKSEFKTRQLIQFIADVDYILTDTELEALILESALIKKHKPKYNIKLRDDKNYQFIKIDYSLPIAKVYSVRRKDERLSPGKAKYFGPFTSGLHVRNTIRLIKRIFPYCQADKIGTRPCFNYQMHRCPGVCIGLVTPEEYRQMIEPVEIFLHGKNKEIKKGLLRQMKFLAHKKQFEKAGALRDQINALQSLDEQQKIISSRDTDQDYISLFRNNTKAAINLFLVRGGKLLAKESLLMDGVLGKTDSEIITAFIERYYLDTTNLPVEIFLETAPEDEKLFTKFVETRFVELTGKKKKIKVVAPQRGTARKLIELGKENARNFLEQQKARFEKEETVVKKGLEELKDVLGLPAIPARIECYDISNISGTSAVGSMVVFTDGLPNKGQYRKFKIKTKHTPDDYAMLAEVLSRRLKNDWPKPDLWVIDGGKGQLGVALSVLQKTGAYVPTIALGKSRSEAKEVREEKIYMPDSEPIELGEGNFALTILQRLRDEAHRFAITYHRDVRSRSLLNGRK